jgi:transcriptional regulator with XRE-family HTH domain
VSALLVRPRVFSRARLRALRSALENGRGWSQTRLARQAMIPTNSYRAYEYGTMEPSLERLAALATVLQVPMDELFQEAQ